MPAEHCFEAGLKYRLIPLRSLPPCTYFLDAFRVAFPSLALLLGDTTDATQASGLVSRILGKDPDAASTHALDGHVDRSSGYPEVGYPDI